MRTPTLVLALAGLIIAGTGPTELAGQAPPPQVLGPPRAGKVQRILLSDGTQLIGVIVAVTDSTVQFESSLGTTTTINRAHISRVREENAGATRNGQYYFANPNATRLLFAPSGRMLDKGEGYFADHWIFLPSINLGLTSRLTLGGGLTLFPGVSPADQMWYLTPKVGVIQGPDVNVAVGAFAGSLPSFDDDGDRESVGILYGVGTWGKPDAHFTAGIGYGYANGELAQRPMFVLGGEARAAPRLSFVTENWLFPGVQILSAGIRLFGPGVSVDFAALAFSGDGDGFCCAPFLGAVWKW